MASIQKRQLSDGTDSYRVVYRDAGKQCADTFYDPDAAAEHLRLVDELGGRAARRLRDQREAAGPAALTVATWCEQYVAGLEAVTDGTRHGYRATIRNRIAPSELGQTPLTRVTRPAVVAFLDAQAVKSGTKRNLQAFIAAALQAAMVTDLIPSNPARGIRIRQVEPTHDMAFLSPGELAVLLSALPARWVPLVATLAGTGLRWGEATALLVGDVDLDARTPLLRVNKAWKKGPGARPVLGPPKTAAGSRTIGLGPEVVEVLRPLIEGKPQDVYVFVSVTGSPVNHSAFGRKVWRPALAALKASGALTKPVRIHDLRHTHASHLVAAGIPLNIVQKRLGHSSITQTVDRYSHLAPDYLAVAAQASSYGLAQALPEIEG